MNFKLYFALIALLICGFSFGQLNSSIDQPYIDTRAEIDTLLVPDRIYLSITLDESDSRDKVSVEAQENKMATTLKGLGVDIEKQLFLADLSTNFQDYFLRRKGVVKAKSFELLLFDALSAGEAIQALEEAGISNVRFQRAELSNIEELKLLLRTKAVEQAMRQAEALLKPLTQKPGRVLFINDLNTGITDNWGVANMRLASESAEAPLDLDFKKIKVRSQLNVRFAIEE